MTANFFQIFSCHASIIFFIRSFLICWEKREISCLYLLIRKAEVKLVAYICVSALRHKKCQWFISVFRKRGGHTRSSHQVITVFREGGDHICNSFSCKSVLSTPNGHVIHPVFLACQKIALDYFCFFFEVSRLFYSFVIFSRVSEALIEMNSINAVFWSVLKNRGGHGHIN